MELATIDRRSSNLLEAAEHVHAVPKFSTKNGFKKELTRRVDDYFAATGQKPRDHWRMYLKSAVVLAWAAASYLLVVFAATEWWQIVPLCVSLGLAMSAIGFNIQHDGNHGAYSERGWVNRLAGLTMDLLGGSSYLWQRKHNVIHHTFANIAGHDDDINLGVVGRMCPHQKHFWWHRWQHLYIWPLYGVLAMRWQFYDDFRNLIQGTAGGKKVPRPKGWDLALFLGFKALFFTLAIALPVYFQGWLVGASIYLLAAFVEGVALAVVFQMAHCVEEANFPLPDPATNKMEDEWAVHQIHTTVDFAPASKFWCWYVGGLNFQVVHHLFPRVCHVHYPALAKVVAETCRDFGVKYSCHPTFWGALKSHYRLLREMGKRPAMA